MKIKIIHNLPYALLALFVMADGFITNLVIRSNAGREGNGLLKGIAGTNNLIIVKLIGACLAVYLLYRISKKYPKLARYTTFTFLVLYALIDVWNLVWLF